MNVCFSRLDHLLVCGIPSGADDWPLCPLGNVGHKLAKPHVRVNLAQFGEQGQKFVSFSFHLGLATVVMTGGNGGG